MNRYSARKSNPKPPKLTKAPKVKIPRVTRTQLTDELLCQPKGLDSLYSQISSLAPTLSGDPSHQLNDLLSLIQTTKKWCSTLIPDSVGELELFLYRIRKLQSKTAVKNKLHSLLGQDLGVPGHRADESDLANPVNSELRGDSPSNAPDPNYEEPPVGFDDIFNIS
ncbi:hypothetical protein GEMRC1_002267 [Eukaryota sp. GEM-RC1]